MHPILGQLRRLSVYLLAWVPLAFILLYLTKALGELSWMRAAALVFPLCLLYAFICLSAWYSCRGNPVDSSSISRLSLTHFVAAAVASCLWVAIARVLGYVLSGVFPGLDRQVARAYPLLAGSGFLLYLLAVALHYVLLSDEASHEAERREAEARLLARDSELKALKTQVNPHFVFNCLNSISALTSSDPAKAREMCILLADFLRKTLGLGEKSMIPLRDELSLLHAYLSVEQIRFGTRLKFDEQTQPEALDNLVPPLLLQPLLENAIRHGISNLVDGGWVRLEVTQSPNELMVRVENNFDLEAPRRRGAGIGLKNVRQRIDANYGNRARFDVHTDHDRFLVAIDLPAEKAE